MGYYVMFSLNQDHFYGVGLLSACPSPYPEEMGSLVIRINTARLLLPKSEPLASRAFGLSPKNIHAPSLCPGETLGVKSPHFS